MRSASPLTTCLQTLVFNTLLTSPPPHTHTPHTQNNYCDCGLFLLTYLEFFVHAAPTQGLEAWLYASNAKERSKLLALAGRRLGGRRAAGVELLSHASSLSLW